MAYADLSRLLVVGMFEKIKLPLAVFIIHGSTSYQSRTGVLSSTDAMPISSPPTVIVWGWGGYLPPLCRHPISIYTDRQDYSDWPRLAAPQTRISEEFLMQNDWQGVFPAATTQFKLDQSLDIEATLRHIDAMIEQGIHGLIMLGTVGENCSLEYPEKLDLLKATVDHVGDRVPVLSGVAEYTTRLAARFAKDAEAAGAQGLMVLPAMVYPADHRENVHHFHQVAAASDLPIMIYNNPVSYKIDILPEQFADFVAEEKFVAIKESSEDPRRITDLRNLYGDRFRLFCGVDDLVLESLILGIEGWISGLVNAFPAENRMLWDLARQGDWQGALEVYRWYTPLLHLDTHPKLIQYIKLAVQQCGLGTETTRAPRLNIEGEERAQVLQIIREAITTRPQPV